MALSSSSNSPFVVRLAILVLSLLCNVDAFAIGFHQPVLENLTVSVAAAAAGSGSGLVHYQGNAVECKMDAASLGELENLSKTLSSMSNVLLREVVQPSLSATNYTSLNDVS